MFIFKTQNATKCNFNIIIVNTYAKQIHQTSTICQKSPLNALQLIVLCVLSSHNIRSTSLIRINTQTNWTFPMKYCLLCLYEQSHYICKLLSGCCFYSIWTKTHTRQGCLNTSEEKQLLNEENMTITQSLRWFGLDHSLRSCYANYLAS